MSYPSDLTDDQWDLLEPVFNYGHLIDQNLWDAAAKFGGTTGATEGTWCRE